jgi:DNA-binding NarL/FixJ family response regulator
MHNDRNGRARTIRVLVADNSRFHSQLLVDVLGRDPELEVGSSDLDPASVLTASIKHKIDVFVLSAVGDEDAQRGFNTLRELKETYPDTRAVILLDSSKPDAVLEAVRAGAKGVFDHRESSDMLCQCIHGLHAGKVWLNNDQMALVVDAVASAPKVRAVGGDGMNLLTKREADVARGVAEGLSNREIAERLGLSQHTIKNHLFRIFDKVGVSSRVELLFMTLSRGTAAPAPLRDLLREPPEALDSETLIFCEKAAERGVLTAQLMLAHVSWNGRGIESDVMRAYRWFSVAIEQLTRTKNIVKKAMKPAQLAEAERAISEQVDSPRIEPVVAGEVPSGFARGVVA